MHDGETAVSPELAAQLVAEQFPHWAALRMRALRVAGSDNVMIRMGEGLVLRFPRIASAAEMLAVEARWLGWASRVVPLAVPELVAEGRPGRDYPYPWAVLRWIPGADALRAPPRNMEAASALAAIVASLWHQQLPMGAALKTGGLRSRDGFLRQMLARITDEAAPREVAQAWEAALALPDWLGPPVPVHADLHPLNLLTRDGRLTAVIDWGGFGAGDPALDLICAWTVLDAPDRGQFRKLLAVDEATWARGWAYALSKAVMAAPYYRETNPALRQVMLTTLRRCLAEGPDCMGRPLWI